MAGDGAVETFIIKQGETEIARITGRNLVFGKRASPSAGLLPTPLIDDQKLLKMLDPENGSTVFIVTLSSRKELVIEKDASSEHTPPAG
jgi:hypothetical protein